MKITQILKEILFKTCKSMNMILSRHMQNIDIQYLVLMRFQYHIDVDILLAANVEIQP